MMPKHTIKDMRGFTLPELLIAMAVSSLVISGASMVFASMIKNYNSQTRMTSMQQNGRAVLHYLERHIRMAGFDQFEQAFSDSGLEVFTELSSDEIGFLVDRGTLVGSSINQKPNGKIDDHWEEKIAFRLEGDKLQRQNAAGTWLLVADNIDALNFVYLDKNGDVTDVSEEVGSVQISIVSRSADRAGFTSVRTAQQRFYNQQGTEIFNAPVDGLQRVAFSSTVSCRNLQ